jgi:hypothetical protein
MIMEKRTNPKVESMKQRIVILESEKQFFHTPKFYISEQEETTKPEEKTVAQQPKQKISVDKLKKGVNFKLGEKLKTLISRKSGGEQNTGTDAGQNETQSLLTLTNELESSNLLKYKDMLKAMAESIVDVANSMDEFYAADCAQFEKDNVPMNQRIPGMEGSASRKAMEPAIRQVIDLFSRIHMDMKTELITKKLLTNEESAKFTVNDAIEMMYGKYNQEKSVLTKVAKSIIQLIGNVANVYVDSEILQILQDGIRTKFGEYHGGLVNSMLLDFIGSTLTVTTGFESKAQCYYNDKDVQKYNT